MIEEKYIQLSQYSYAKANLSMRVLRAVYRFSIMYYQNKNCEVIIPKINPVNLLKKNSSGKKFHLEETISMWII